MTARITSPWTARLIAVASVCLLVGFLVGNRGQTANAQATGTAAQDAARTLAQRELVPIIVQPPAITMKDGLALVGGADGRYYLIDDEGVARLVYWDRRTEIYWR